MGVNIIPYRIVGRDKEGYRITEKYTGEFKSFGERAFTRSLPDDFWESIEDNPDKKYEMQECYSRPRDIDKAIEWVKENSEREDIVKLFEEMKLDEDLYITISY